MDRSKPVTSCLGAPDYWVPELVEVSVLGRYLNDKIENFQAWKITREIVVLTYVNCIKKRDHCMPNVLSKICIVHLYCQRGYVASEFSTFSRNTLA